MCPISGGREFQTDGAIQKKGRWPNVLVLTCGKRRVLELATNCPVCLFVIVVVVLHEFSNGYVCENLDAPPPSPGFSINLSALLCACCTPAFCVCACARARACVRACVRVCVLGTEMNRCITFLM